MIEKLEPGLTFVLGGARSGKSSFAEGLIEATRMEAIYIATGRAWDGEMSERISAHRKRRGVLWATIEEPIELASTLDRVCGHGRAVLVDCLTLWLTNLMIENRDIEAEINHLGAALERASGAVLLVSNEVGLGIVPENALAREFRDRAGQLHQAVASIATTVYFVAAGLPLKMKG